MAQSTGSLRDKEVIDPQDRPENDNSSGSNLSLVSGECDPALLNLLKCASRVESVLLLPTNLLREELERRGLQIPRKKSECAQLIIDDNSTRAAAENANSAPELPQPPRRLEVLLEDSTSSNDGAEIASNVIRHENPSEVSRDLTSGPYSASLIPRQQHESMEDFYARMMFTMSQSVVEVQRQFAVSSKSIEVHTTPDISNTLPEFSAKTGEKAKDFVKAIERAAGQQKWNSSLTVAMAASKLRSEAKSWHETTGVDHDDEWNEWKRKFLEHFGKESSFAEWQCELKNRVQGIDESISAFVQAKLKLFKCSRYGNTLTLEDKIDSICQGLRNEATRTLLWNKYDSMDDFVRTARIRQRHDEYAESLQKDAKPKISRMNSYDFRKDTERRSETDSDHEKRKGNEESRSGVRSRDSPVFIKGRSNTNMCYNCFETGHLSRDCKKPKTERTLKAEKERNARLHRQSQTRTIEVKSEKQANCFLQTVSRGLPIVFATLFDSKLKVCIDSGANVSIINERCVTSEMLRYKWIGVESIKIMDRSFNPNHAVTADITVGNIKVSLPNVIVSEHCPFDMLLGSDWRALANVNVTFHPNNDVTVVAVDKRTKTLGDTNNPNLKNEGEALVVSCWHSPARAECESSHNDFIVFSAVSPRENEIDEELNENIEQAANTATKDATDVQRNRLREILRQNHKAFVSKTDNLGLCPHAEHSIELRDNIPVVSRPYRCSPADREFLRQQVAEHMKNGIVRESDSEYASPTLVVNQPHHPSTPRRMVHDYRQLNAKTVNTPYPMPIIEDVIDEITMNEAKYFNVMDVKMAFLTIRMKPEDVHKTAFVTPDGKYEYLRMAFGFCKAPQTMQSVMRKTFDGLPSTATYMDDVGQGSKTVDDVLDSLDLALQRIIVNGLKMDIKKCQLVRDQISFLGYVISSEGKLPDPKRVADIERFTPHRDTKRLYSFLQFANYFRKFIEGFARMTVPLRKLLLKDAPFVWTDEHQRIVDDLKQRLKAPPILSCFVPGLPTIVMVDASQSGLGAVLVQHKDGHERVVEYASKSLNAHDSQLHSNVLECMAVHWAIVEKFAIYLRGGPRFTVLTDNYSIVYLSKLAAMNRRFSRWILDLMEYEFEIRHRSGRTNVVADALSRIDNSSDQSNDTIDRAVCLAIIHTANDRLRILQESDPQCQSKRRLIAQDNSSEFQTEEGLLIRRHPHDGRIVRQLVIPENLRETIMSMCHDDSGHMGFQKTIDKITRKYWWPGMNEQIRSYVTTCLTCQRINARTTQPMGILIPREIPENPNDTVSIDYIGPLPEIEGSRYLLVCVDHATRYLDAVPVISTSAREYFLFLMNRWIYRLGVPHAIVTDQGRGFISKRASNAYRRLGIAHVTTSAYWPQANGLVVVERMISTIKQALRKFLLSRKSWIESIPEVVFAINVSKQSSTKFSPFELMHGFLPTLPGEMNIGIIEEELAETDRLRSLIELRRKSRKNLIDSVNYQKSHYDAKHKTPSFKIDDIVLYPVGQRSNTFDPLFEEPHRITEFLNDNTVRITRIVPIPNRADSTIANIQQLRHCSIRDNEWTTIIPDYLFEHVAARPTGE